MEQHFQSLFLGFSQLIALFAVGERAVYQLKKLLDSLQAPKRCPLLSVGMGFLIVFAYDLKILEWIVQEPASGTVFGLPVGGMVDTAVSTLVASGGPGAIYDIWRKIHQNRQKLVDAQRTG